MIKARDETGPWTIEELQARLHNYREESGETADAASIDSFLTWLDKNG